MGRKLLSIILALLMAILVLPVGVNAGEDGRELTFNKLENTAKKQLKEDKVFKLEDINPPEEVRPSEGQAYAILTVEGEFIFFRSNETYTNNTSATAEDIKGNIYTGTVYSGIETLKVVTLSDIDNIPWYGSSGSIKSVKVADDQIIKPVSMSYWFYHCSNLLSADMRGFDTSNATGMGNMFTNCSSLTSLDVSGFDTSNVTDMNWMFSSCQSLTSLDLSGFNTSNVTRMDYMFYWCNNLTSLDLSNFDTSNVITMRSMFLRCSSLTSLNLSSFDTSNVTEIDGMFQDCISLTSLDLSSFDTSNVTEIGGMFANCSSLTSLDISSFDTSNATSMDSMFYNCSSLTSLDVSGFDTSNVESMYGMFYNCSSLTSLDLSGFDTSNVTRMTIMFQDCISLTSLDLSSFDTSNVTEIGGMFANCSSLTSLDLSSFDTSNVITMDSMFYNCSSLTSLDLSSFNTSNVTNMGVMFYNCSSLTSLDLSSFDTSNVTNMGVMFKDCRSLTNLGISSFDTSNVTDMGGMFEHCRGLTSLDLRSFDTSNVTYMSYMFNGCSRFTSISLGNKFIVWRDEAYLPQGTWINRELNLSLSEVELYNQYPSHRNEWAGTWAKDDGNPQSIMLDKTNVTVKYNGTVQLKASVSPEDARDKTVIWSSDNTAIATVNSNGLVKGKGIGTATITATTSNGLTATCEVRVLFKDVADKDKYYYDPVYWALDNNITTGTSPSEFTPGENVTRGQMVTFLYRLAGTPEPKTGRSFDDVDPSRYYAKAITWAAENGITTGYAGTNKFGPDNFCTREQIVTFLWRYAKTPKPGKNANFTDAKAGAYYLDALSWAAEKGITVGLNDGTGRFGVGQACTRGMCVTFLYRYANQ